MMNDTETGPHGALTPWTPDQCRAFVRWMYRIDHLVTAEEAATIVGLSHGRFMGHARQLGLGRFLFGKVRFTTDDLERIRRRPDRRIRSQCGG